MGIPQTWSFDAPTGTYKNHAMSSNLRTASVADTEFMAHVRPEAGYGKGMGETLNITRVSAITVPTDGKLTEGVRIPERSISLSTVSVTVSEWGEAVPYTSLSGDLSKFDMSSIIQQQLKNQMAEVMDNAAATAFKTTKLVASMTAAGTMTLATGGAATAQSTVQLNTFHLETALDSLYGTYRAPRIGGDYVLIVNYKAARGIRDDPAWEEWHKYVNPDAKFKNETGRWEDARIIRTNNNTALSNTIGSTSDIGEAVLFGDDTVILAAVLDPELRMAQPADFGRALAVAWYGILEFKLHWDTANAGEARCIYFSST